MIYIAICDDDKNELEVLKKEVMFFLKNNHVFAAVTVYAQSRMLQFDIEEGKYYDLILSDIEMPYVGGMDLAAFSKTFLPEVLIIFVTSHLKYAVDAFELSIFRYVPKNSLKERLPHALKDAINMINIQEDKCYIIELPSRVEKIPYRKIVYIQREGKNSIIYMVDHSLTKVRKSLICVFKELKSEDFVYVDRGNIVNLIHIMGIKNRMIELKNGTQLLTSQSRLEMIKTKLSDFWEKQI